MNIPVRSMTILALAGLGTALVAADTPVAAPSPIMPGVKDSGLKVAIGGQLQARAEWSKADSGNPDSHYNVNDTTSGNTNRSDVLDFSMRRVRLIARGSWKEDTRFVVGLYADNDDKNGTNVTENAGANYNNRNFGIYQASVTHDFKGTDVTSSIQVGLDWAWFNTAAMSASATHLLPAQRATNRMMAVRGTGLGYRMIAPCISFGVDVQNNTGDDNNISARYQSEGLVYTGRVEFTPMGDWAIKPGDFRESFAGKAGKGVMVGWDIGYNQHDLLTAATVPTAAGVPNAYVVGVDADAIWANTLVTGLEALLHVDNLSALIQYRWQKSTNVVETTPAAGSALNDGKVLGSIFIIQAGYAFAYSSTIVEPVFRYTLQDLDMNTRESGTFGIAEYGNSGTQYEIGANWYLNGAGVYSNKISLLYTRWLAEDFAAAGGKASANIVRAQYQWLF
jgi:hypothetical protein